MTGHDPVAVLIYATLFHSLLSATGLENFGSVYTCAIDLENNVLAYSSALTDMIPDFKRTWDGTYNLQIASDLAQMTLVLPLSWQ